jgi:phosphatidylserine decarboxylase
MKRRFRIAPIAYDGWKFILGFGLLAFLFLFFGLWFSRVVGALCALFAVFCMAFFRDPERTIPATDDILSPADGTVLEVTTVEDEGYGPGRVVRIFLSIFDGHIQRSPVAGRVIGVKYAAGVFLDARDPRAPFANENNAIEIESAKGRVMVRQIAGIICWVRPDDPVDGGERIGLIRFGSQVNLYVPMDAAVSVKEGDKVVAGQTVMARWPAQAALPETAAAAQVMAEAERAEAPSAGEKAG